MNLRLIPLSRELTGDWKQATAHVYLFFLMIMNDYDVFRTGVRQSDFCF